MIDVCHPTLRRPLALPARSRPTKIKATSRTSKRQLTVLAAISGIIKVAHNRASAPDLRELLARADRLTDQAIERWDAPGCGQDLLRYAAEALVKWDAVIPEDEITITGSVALALHLLTDLEALVSHRGNKARANTLFAPTQAAYDWLDERGANWPAIGWAEEIADKLYRIVGET